MGLKAFEEIKDAYFINAISSLAEEIKVEKTENILLNPY